MLYNIVKNMCYESYRSFEEGSIETHSQNTERGPEHS